MAIQNIVFYIFATLLILSAVLMITVRNPVYAILCLIFCFLCSAILWLLLQAEFLALVLIFVYVGAVMTLFLFVVMMLNIRATIQKEGFVRYLPVAVLVMVLLLIALFFVIHNLHLPPLSRALPHYLVTYSNVEQLGLLLYTRYLYPFAITAVILLAAIISAIVLALPKRKKQLQLLTISQQLQARKVDRLRLVDIDSHKTESKSHE